MGFEVEKTGAKSRPTHHGRCPNLSKRVWRVARPLLIVYLLVLLLVSTFQEFLIFPGLLHQGDPASIVATPTDPGLELVRLKTADGSPLVGLYGTALAADGSRPADARSRSTVLYFYGNDSSLARSLDQIKMFRRLGANVLAVDYAGYGMSGGSAGEHELYASADGAYAELTRKRGILPDRIVAAGWSLGGAVAIDLAARRPLGGLITFNTFTSMSEMAGLQYPWLPARFFLRHRFESERKLANARMPALFVHGLADTVIPHESVDRLRRAAAGDTEVFEVPGAGHEDIFEVGGPAMERAIGRFLIGLESAREQGDSSGSR